MKDNGNSRIDEGRQIDDLFRQGLENLSPEPSRDLWKGINQRLWWDEISHFTFTNLSKIFLIGGIAGMMILITALMVIIIPETSGSEDNTLSSLSGQGSSEAGLTIPVSMVSSHPAPASAIIASGTEAGKSVSSENEPNTNPGPVDNRTKEQSGVNPASSEPVPATEQDYITEAVDHSFRNTGLLSAMEPLTSEPYLVDAGSAGPITGPVIIQNIIKAKPPVPSFFSAGFGVTPQVTFNSSATSHNEMTFAGDAAFEYHAGRFSIRSGIGINYMADDGIYKVEYKSKDSVGFYTQVVSYAINQQDPSKIDYVLSKVTVYDSLQHIADDRTRNRYTYLQIPLLAGYRFLETSKLGLTVYAGPMVSFLIRQKEAEPVIDYPNATIIRIDNSTPARVVTNWQLWLGLRLDYKITKEFSVFAEPCYKYYFQPVVEAGETPATNPYSIGLGIGIQYNFGRKLIEP